MFGRRNLQRDGETAQAVVISATAGGGSVRVDWHVRVLVHLDDGTEHEGELRVRDTELRLPSAGDVLPVRVDPKDRARVELDHAAFAAPQPEADRSSPPTDAEIAATSTAWDAAREQAAQRMSAYEQAKAAGDTTEAKRLFAEGQVFNAEQIRLGGEVRQMRARRPDPTSTE